MPTTPRTSGDALATYRLRATRVGIRLTFIVVAMLAVYRFLPGRGTWNTTLYSLLLLTAVGGAVVVSLLPWQRMLEGPMGTACLYGWSILDIVLISWAVAITGYGRSELFLLYALTTCFFAASYPPKGQVGLLAFTLTSYLVVLGVGGWNQNTAEVFIRCATLCTIAVISSFLSKELLDTMGDNDVARAESDTRAGLLAMVASAARGMSTLDTEKVMGIVVDSLVEMGLDAAQICLFDEAAQSWFVAHQRGDTGDTELVQPIDRGLAGAVRQRRETVVVDDYAAWPGGVAEVRAFGYRFVVASPVWSAGELAGAVIAGSLSARTPSVHEIECIDMLAAQAGAALHNARLFSERRAFEARLAHQAFHDALTKLPNRSLFIDRLAHATARAKRTGEQLAVLFLDLDRFKNVNDSLGHDAGDALLKAVAERLGSCVREGDTLARYGGDEFTILLERVGSEAAAVEVAERILSALNEPFAIAGRELVVSGSLGIALPDVDALDLADPLREADLAMYRAKERGKARWELYHSEMNAVAVRRLELESELRHAIDSDQLFLMYQPLVELATGSVIGVEALVRWQHPTKGVIPPLEFIPLAEETGLILALGRWVLEEACRQAKEWDDAGVQPLQMSINLSADQFQRVELSEQLRTTLERIGIAPERLTLEITESVVMADAEAAVSVMQDVHRLGAGLALDDFGQGYSSLSYLKRFPLDSVKVDKLFVDGIVDNSEDQAIVRSVVALAAALGIAVTAEGIEEEAQLQWLRALGVDVGQGYLFSRPVAASAIPELVTRRLPHADSWAPAVTPIARITSQ